MRRATATAALSLLMGACNGQGSSQGPAPIPSATTTTAPPLPVQRPPSSAVSNELTPPTYYQDVEPIFAARCVQCHDDGSVGTPDLTDVVAAREYARKSARVIDEGSMPPWLPGPGSPPLMHATNLTPAQIELVGTWARSGAPLGDPSHPGAPIEHEVVELGTVDLHFDIGADYQPDGALDDDYRCFLVDPGVVEDRLAIGFRVVAGNRTLVHHAGVTFFDASSRAALEALDARTTDRAGWPCLAGPVPEDLAGVRRVSSLGVWDPGVAAVKLPTGSGAPVPAGALAVVQMHYRVMGGAPDRSRVDVAFAPKATTPAPLALARIVERTLSIPPDVAEVAVEKTTTIAESLGAFYADGDGWVMIVATQMQLLGVRASLEVQRAGGAVTLLEIPRWSMHWQGAYQLVTPIRVEATDVLRLRCVYDNTLAHHLDVDYRAPMHTVTWGETAADEVCIGEIALVDELP
jgi:mono/diheme cytochrome c family protein